MAVFFSYNIHAIALLKKRLNFKETAATIKFLRFLFIHHIVFKRVLSVFPTLIALFLFLTFYFSHTVIEYDVLLNLKVSF